MGLVWFCRVQSMYSICDNLWPLGITVLMLLRNAALKLPYNHVLPSRPLARLYTNWYCATF